MVETKKRTCKSKPPKPPKPKRPKRPKRPKLPNPKPRPGRNGAKAPLGHRRLKVGEWKVRF